MSKFRPSFIHGEDMVVWIKLQVMPGYRAKTGPSAVIPLLSRNVHGHKT